MRFSSGRSSGICATPSAWSQLEPITTIIAGNLATLTIAILKPYGTKFLRCARPYAKAVYSPVEKKPKTMRQVFDPVVLSAMRKPEELLLENSRGALFRKPAWDKSRVKYCDALIDSTAVLFEIWLKKLSADHARAIRDLDQHALESLAEFFAWLVIFSFRLVNDVSEETGTILSVYTYALFPESLGFEHKGRDLFAAYSESQEPISEQTLESASEADRWQMEHLPFLRPAVATIAALSHFPPLDEQQQVSLQSALGPTLNSVVLHFGNALGVRASGLVPL